MATQQEYQWLRIDCGLAATDIVTLPDAQAEDNFDRAAIIYPDPTNPAGAEYAYARVITLEQLYAAAVTQVDYTQNNSQEKASQLFDHYGKLLDMWKGKVKEAGLGGASGGTAIFQVIGRREMVSVAQRSAQRAQNAYRRVQDKPATIVFRKPQPPGRPLSLPAQTLRVEVDNRASVATGAAGAAPTLGVVVYGWRDHPTLPNSDIAEGYTFVLNGDIYRIQDVILSLGEIQGTGVRTG